MHYSKNKTKKGEKNMSKNVSIEIVLIISVLEGIFSALAYPQYKIVQETQQSHDSLIYLNL